MHCAIAAFIHTASTAVGAHALPAPAVVFLVATTTRASAAIAMSCAIAAII